MIKPLGVIGAIFAAGVGALVWGAISTFLDVEFGFIAWGIGAGIGLTSLLLGSKGTLNGIVCVALTLLAIGTGKVVPYYLINEDDLALSFMDDWLDKEHYDEIMLDAKAFKKLKDESKYPNYMVDRFYTDETDPKQVTPEEVEEFKQDYLPNIKWAIDNEPSYEEWREYMFEKESGYGTTMARKTLADTTFADRVRFATEDMTAIDIIFVVLGVASAFGMGRGRVEPTQQS
jgi:hypothetical protein